METIDKMANFSDDTIADLNETLLHVLMDWADARTNMVHTELRMDREKESVKRYVLHLFCYSTHIIASVS
jgi:hypothetical protein